MMTDDINKPFFREDRTALVYVRSALFSLKPKSEREFLKNYQLCKSGNFDFLYTGEVLSQYDRDVELAFKKAYLDFSHGELGCEISINEAFKRMRKKNYGTNDIRLLFESLRRKTDTFYSIEENNCHFEGRPIQKLIITPCQKKFIIEFNENWIQFCNSITFVPLNRQERFKLPIGFVRWLHGYWSSYDKIPTSSVDELRVLCGSKEKLKGNFKKIVVNAMNILQKEKIIEEGWSIDRSGHIIATRSI